jgi:hypothetical protein
MNPNRQNRLPLPSVSSSSSFPQHQLIFFSDEEEEVPQVLQDPLEKPIEFGELVPSDRGGWHDRSNRSALLSIGGNYSSTQPAPCVTHS